jgi:hypothetical protein
METRWLQYPLPTRVAGTTGAVASAPSVLPENGKSGGPDRRQEGDNTRLWSRRKWWATDDSTQPARESETGLPSRAPSTSRASSGTAATSDTIAAARLAAPRSRVGMAVHRAFVFSQMRVLLERPLSAARHVALEVSHIHVD